MGNFLRVSSNNHEGVLKELTKIRNNDGNIGGQPSECKRGHPRKNHLWGILSRCFCLVSYEDYIMEC